jgi:hypothetical protein
MFALEGRLEKVIVSPLDILLIPSTLEVSKYILFLSNDEIPDLIILGL